MDISNREKNYLKEIYDKGITEVTVANIFEALSKFTITLSEQGKTREKLVTETDYNTAHNEANIINNLLHKLVTNNLAIEETYSEPIIPFKIGNKQLTAIEDYSKVKYHLKKNDILFLLNHHFKTREEISKQQRNFIKEWLPLGISVSALLITALPNFWAIFHPQRQEIYVKELPNKENYESLQNQLSELKEQILLLRKDGSKIDSSESPEGTETTKIVEKEDPESTRVDTPDDSL